LPAGAAHLTKDGAVKLWQVKPDLLAALAAEAFTDLEFFLSTAHLEGLARIARDPGALPGERYVAATLIKNAAVAAEGIFPLCQDTGTATVVAWKGEGIRTGADDAAVISAAVRAVWRKYYLRYSQVAPLGMFDEKNTGDNLPAQVDIYAVPGNEYQFLFIAKGGGSSNKTVFIQGSKAVLEEKALEKLLAEQIGALGVAACPPYHLAVVIGGTSPENNLAMLKLATAGCLDVLPFSGNRTGRVFRDRVWEKRVMAMARATGLGAQFGGKHLVMEARVIRLPRHAASCPISIGVSCCAHRNIRGKITARGVFLEDLERNPARFLKACRGIPGISERISLDRPMKSILADLKKHKPGSLLLLDGTLIVARDMAHARFVKSLRAGGKVPEYLGKHPVFYAGPAETPPGKIIGSLGPTTAGRMDSYVPELMARGASLVMLAKGNRSPAVAAACRRHGGFYLAAVGGAAALMARDNVVAAEVIDYADLGMEAVRRIRVKNLPAMLVLP
jgi:fumarate hydratase class I